MKIHGNISEISTKQQNVKSPKMTAEYQIENLNENWRHNSHLNTKHVKFVDLLLVLKQRKIYYFNLIDIKV